MNAAKTFAVMRWIDDGHRLSVHNINQIVDPKKPLDMYQVGDTGRSLYRGFPGTWSFRILAVGGKEEMKSWLDANIEQLTHDVTDKFCQGDNESQLDERSTPKSQLDERSTPKKRKTETITSTGVHRTSPAKSFIQGDNESQLDERSTPKSQLDERSTPKSQLDERSTPKKRKTETITSTGAHRTSPAKSFIQGDNESQLDERSTPKSQLDERSTPKSQLDERSTPKKRKTETITSTGAHRTSPAKSFIQGDKSLTDEISKPKKSTPGTASNPPATSSTPVMSPIQGASSEKVENMYLKRNSASSGDRLKKLEREVVSLKERVKRLERLSTISKANDEGHQSKAKDEGHQSKPKDEGHQSKPKDEGHQAKDEENVNTSGIHGDINILKYLTFHVFTTDEVMNCSRTGKRSNKNMDASRPALDPAKLAKLQGLVREHIGPHYDKDMFHKKFENLQKVMRRK